MHQTASFSSQKVTCLRMQPLLQHMMASKDRSRQVLLQQ
jgi:hypothetical protein